MNPTTKRLTIAGAIASLFAATLGWFVARGGLRQQGEGASLSEARAAGDSTGSAAGKRSPQLVSGREGAQPGAGEGNEETAGGNETLRRELPTNTPGALIAAVEMIPGNEQPHLHAVDKDAKPPFPPTREGIRKAMRSSTSAIRECYEAWLQADDKLSGRIDLAFTITAKSGGGGEIKTVTVADGGMGNIAFQGCMRSVVAELEFDSPEGEMQVQYPLVFKTSN